jgi:hypothetical protein
LAKQKKHVMSSFGRPLPFCLEEGRLADLLIF